MDVHERPDQVVIDKVLSGDDAAYGVLVDRYKDFVYTLSLRILKNESDAEEAAQDAFIKAFQSLKRFAGDSKFSTWLYRIAFNTSITYKRRRRIEVTTLEEGSLKMNGFATTSDRIQAEDQKRFIETGLRRMNSTDAAVLTLFYLKELSIDEVSDATGLSQSSVKVRLFRARKRLAQEMKDELAHEALTLIQND